MQVLHIIFRRQRRTHSTFCLSYVSVSAVRGSKGNFQQTAGSIGTKLEKNIRFLIETTLPKISSSPGCVVRAVALLSVSAKRGFSVLPLLSIEARYRALGRVADLAIVLTLHWEPINYHPGEPLNIYESIRGRAPRLGPIHARRPSIFARPVPTVAPVKYEWSKF